MTRYYQRFGRLAGLVSALLFVWMTALHGQTQLKLSQLPVEIQMSVEDICGDAGNTFGWGGKCPLCNIEEEIIAQALPPVRLPTEVACPDFVQRMLAASITLPHWTRAPVRGPPTFTV